MDPGESESDSSLPQPENPCLIVEDSQPDSAALEDDPESSYRALLLRRLSNLQPGPHSPVLELISSPAGSRCSQTNSQSERSQTNSVSGSAIPGTTDPSTAFQEESQVLNIRPHPNKNKCPSEDMDSGADSTTHCAQSEEGTSQLGFLELSQSQVMDADASVEEDENAIYLQTDSERHRKLEQNTYPGSSGYQGSKSRSEVSSSSSSAPLSQTDGDLRAKALLHSQVLHSTGNRDHDRQEVLSSQEDLFDVDKSGADVDSTVSEPDHQGQPTLTPAHSLRLLHLSGHSGTLVQESLSQRSVDFVAPTPDNQTPLIVPNSPTELDEPNEHEADEPMDTSLPPEDQFDDKEDVPMETDILSKPHPSASTPVSQNSPGFVLGRHLSLPSQPEFSHDVFVPTQSQEAVAGGGGSPQDPCGKTATLSLGRPPPSVETAPFTLQLTVNTETSSPPRQSPERVEVDVEEEALEEDSQATQIDSLDGGPLGGVDAGSDSAPAPLRCSERNTAGVPTTSSLDAPDSPRAGVVRGDRVSGTEDSRLPETPDTVKCGAPAAMLNVQSVRVTRGTNGTDKSQPGAARHPAAESGSQPGLMNLTTAPSPAPSPAPPLGSPLGPPANGTPGSLAARSPSRSVFAPTVIAHLKVGDVAAASSGTEAVQTTAANSQSAVNSQTAAVGQTAANSQTAVNSQTTAVGQTAANSQSAANSQTAVNSQTTAVGQTAANSQSAAVDSQTAIVSRSAAVSHTSANNQTSANIQSAVNNQSVVNSQTSANSQTGNTFKGDCGSGVVVLMEEEGKEEEEEDTVGPGGSDLGLALSQSRLLSPEPMEEGVGEDSEVVELEDSGRSLRAEKGPSLSSEGVGSQTAGRVASAPTNGHGSQVQSKEIPPPDRLSQADGERPEPEGLKDSRLSDSSGDIHFHFTLPKEGELIGPSVSATPPLISHLKQTPRHSTPIESTSFSQKSDMAADVSVEAAMTASDIVSGESGENVAETADGKLSLRMKLVTPVQEGSSDRFSLQRPPLSDTDGSVVKVTTVSKSVTSLSVFSRVRQVHRQQEEEETQPFYADVPVRGELFSSPQRSSQASSLGCNSLPNSQSDATVCPAPPPETRKEPLPTPAPSPATAVAMETEAPEVPEPSTPNRTDARQKAVSQQTSFDTNTPVSPASKGEAETPSFRRATGPANRRHVRTIQEVRTTVTRIITDVYYEDGKEVERKVTEENEEPVVDCQVLDSDISPCRTGSSLTSGDLADISSQSSKASSLQHSSGSGGISGGSSGPVRPAFAMPHSRGAKSATSPRRGGGQQQRGHGRGQRSGQVVTKGSPGSPRALAPLTPRGRARRGRPPSRPSLSRGGGGAVAMSSGTHGGPPHWSSEDEPYTRVRPLPLPRPDSPFPAAGGGGSSELEEAGAGVHGDGGGSSLVGLRVVAKWSSNGYFYSGLITRDLGEGRFRLRFDDGYECEVAGRDVLLCDPIPVDTEVTALLEDEYFSVGVVKGHKTEGQALFYSVEREGHTEWYSRSSVILSLEQGNRLREQHSLGPYEPTTPLTKASDISLDNLVEGKRRRRGDQGTPDARSSGSPRTAGPSGKRKLMGGADAHRTPAKRGRRGGFRGGQRVGVCNTSGSGSDFPGRLCDVAESHGPLPQNTSLFMGFVFMLTASSESDRLTNKLASEDDEEEYVQTAPYNRSYTESQLQAGGGFVLVEFNEDQCKAAYQSLLIADQHCRTRRYLLCVAGGVPCVSHIWVRDCCKENKLLNYRNYLLPAGMGPDTDIVEWHPRCNPFKALRVLLVFDEPVELWAQLLSMNGASSVKHYQANDSSDVSPDSFDVVVTDCACAPLVKKNVTSQKVPMVSPEWLIQSVICGERLDYDSKPQYHHDYSS